MFVLVSAIVVDLNAQTPESAKSSNEISFQHHVIRVYKTSSSGYLYDIFFKNNLVIHQNVNPFTETGEGLRTKEDAFKIAKWQIIQMFANKRNSQPGINLQKIPMEVARQLNISLD